MAQPQFNFPAPRGGMPINANLPNVDFNPAPQPNFVDAAMTGLERGQSLGLRQKQMEIAQQQAMQRQQQHEMEQESKAIENIKNKSYFYETPWFKALEPDMQTKFHQSYLRDLKKATKLDIDDNDKYEPADGEAAKALGSLFEDETLSLEDKRGMSASIIANAQKRGATKDQLADLRSTVQMGLGGGKYGSEGFYFVDPGTKQMFDPNLNPISQAPVGATPKMLSNPNTGSEMQKRGGLVTGATRSVATAKGLLTPSVLSEIKSIKYTPGKIYSQLASPEAKKFYRHLSNAIANELYIKSGATATPDEIEKKMVMYMPAANDDINDMSDRLDMLGGEVSLFNPGGAMEQQPKKDSLGLFK